MYVQGLMNNDFYILNGFLRPLSIAFLTLETKMNKYKNIKC